MAEGTYGSTHGTTVVRGFDVWQGVEGGVLEMEGSGPDRTQDATQEHGAARWLSEARVRGLESLESTSFEPA